MDEEAIPTEEELDLLFAHWERYLAFWDQVRADAAGNPAAAALYDMFLDYRAAQLTSLDWPASVVARRTRAGKPVEDPIRCDEQLRSGMQGWST